MLTGWFAELGLDPALLPPPLRADGAFETVTKDTVSSYTIPPNDARKVTLMIRPVSRDDRAIVTHLVREVRDPAGKKLKYTPGIAEITFHRMPGGDGHLAITGGLAPVPAREHDEVTRMLDAVRAGFDLRRQCYTGDKIRAMMHRYFEQMHALKARPTGGVYFLHTHRAATLQALAELLSRFGSGSTLYLLPLPDQDRHRTMVIDAFRTKVREDLQKLSADIADAKRAAARRRGHVHARTAEALFARYRDLKAEAGEHSELLQADLFDAGEALTLTGRQIADMIAAG